MDTPQEAIEEIARLIVAGYTSGILDGEEGKRTTWSIEIETFTRN